MSIIRWQPLKELDTIRHQFNQLLDDLMHGDLEPSISPFNKLENVLWAPAVELKETDTDFIVKFFVPGIKVEELDVQVSENAVSIAGERQEETHTKDKGYFRSELQYGQFQRVIPLPQAVKHDQVQAELKEGVLLLTIPKAESTPPKVTKVNLTTLEKARESVAQQRQQEEHLQQTMRARAAAELETAGSPSA